MATRKSARINLRDGLAHPDEAVNRLLDEINGWFDSARGQQVLSLQEAVLGKLLPGIFGYHLLQLGPLEKDLFRSSQIGTCTRLSLRTSPGAGILGNPACLPFKDDSLDLVLLHHALDFISSPGEQLREAARVTMPSGYLLLIGFNPVSLWGLGRPLLRFRRRVPWGAAFIRMHRLLDWLDLLNFQTDRVIYGLHGPGLFAPQSSAPDFSRGLSRHTNWPFGAVYIVVARKWMRTAKPLRPSWKSRPVMTNLKVVKGYRKEA